MNKFDNCKGSGLPNSGFSSGGVVPKDIRFEKSDFVFAATDPFLMYEFKKTIEKERREIMAEKIFTKEDFDRIVEENIKRFRKDNEIKSSFVFNMDSAKVEEGITRLFQDPEFTKRFRENMQDIFTLKRSIFTPTGRREEKKDGPRLIFEYIKKKKRGVVGLLVGYKPVGRNVFAIGQSLCNPKDEFDLFTAFQLAFESMFKQQTYKTIAPSIRWQKTAFLNRCVSYFKTKRCLYINDGFFDKLWVDFCSCIPEEVKEKMDVDHFSFKSFEAQPYKKEENKVNVMFANIVDVENVMENEFHSRLFQGEGFLYKNIRFGGCTKERPKTRCIKITWEFLD